MELAYQGLFIRLPFEGAVGVEAFEMNASFNDHVTLRLLLLVEEEKIEALIHGIGDGDDIEVYKAEADGLLYAGKITDAKMEQDRSLHLLQLEAASYTMEWGLAPVSQSFLNLDTTYRQVMDKVLKNQKDAEILDCATKGAVIPDFLLQYEESDWNFLVRLASHFHTFMVPDCRAAHGRAYFGIPDLGEEYVLSDEEFTEIKDMDQYYRLGREQKILPQETLKWKVTARQDFCLAQKVRFRGISAIVTRIQYQTVEGELVRTYELSRRKGVLCAPEKNPHIFGMSIPATVKERSGNCVRVHFHIDPEYDNSPNVKYFTYAIESSFIYCMPEVGSQVHIYFPGDDEKDAIAVHAIRTSSGSSSSGYAQIPDNKSFSNVNGAELLMTPSKAIVSADQEKQTCVYLDTDGNALITGKKICLHAEKNLIVGDPAEEDGQASRQMVLEAEELTVQVGGNGSQINLTDEARIIAAFVKMDASDRSPAANPSLEELRSSVTANDETNRKNINEDVSNELVEKFEEGRTSILKGIVKVAATVATVAVAVALTAATGGAAAVIIATVVLGAATAAYAVADVGEGIDNYKNAQSGDLSQGHNFMRDDVFGGNELLYELVRAGTEIAFGVVSGCAIGSAFNKLMTAEKFIHLAKEAKCLKAVMQIGGNVLDGIFDDLARTGEINPARTLWNIGIGFAQGSTGSGIRDGLLSKLGIEGCSFGNHLIKTFLGGFIDTGIDGVGSALSEQDFDLKSSLIQNLFFNGLDAFISDPVDAVTGIYVIQATDFLLASVPFALKLERSYYSTNNTVSVLGLGWKFPYASRIYRDTRDVEHTRVHLETITGHSVCYEEQDGRWVNQSKGASRFLMEVQEAEITGQERYVLTDVVDHTLSVYDARGLLQSVEYPNQQRLSFAYGEEGLERIVTPLGNVLQVECRGGRILQITDEIGRRTQYRYEGDLLVDVVHTDEGITHYEYDENGHISSVTDQNGSCYLENEYDVKGRVTRQNFSSGVYQTFTYDDIHHRNTIYYSETGKTEIYEYNNRFLKERVIYEDGSFQTYQYSDDNLKVEEISRLGSRKEWEYDAYGRSIREKFPDGFEVHHEYNEHHDLVHTWDSDGRETLYTYDQEHNPVRTMEKIKEGKWKETARKYDFRGRCILERDALGNESLKEYEANRAYPSRVITPKGEETAYGYDTVGRRLSISNTYGTVELAYNSRNFVTSRIDGEGYTTRRFYDRMGNLTTYYPPVQWEKKESGYEYRHDFLERVVDTISPLQEHHRVFRNFDGDITSRIHPVSYALKGEEGEGTRYEYNSDGNCIRILYPDGGVERRFYDADGNMIKQVQPESYDADSDDGNGYRYAYDACGRMTEVQDPGGNILHTYEYNGHGQILREVDGEGKEILYTYNDLGWKIREQIKVQETDPALYRVIAYTYDSQGNKVEEAYGQQEVERDGEPDGWHRIHFSYDKNNHLNVVKDDFGAKMRYDYDCLGNVTLEERVIADGVHSVIHYAYNKNGWLVQRTEEIQGNGPVQAAVTRYAYDANGNLTKITTPKGSEIRRSYDADDRLTEERVLDRKNGIDRRVQYTYDAAGNVLKQAILGTDGECLESSTRYDLKDRATHRTNPAGGVTRYLYDRNDRLRKEISPYGYEPESDDGAGVSYTYDSRGNRLRTTNALGEVVQELSYNLRNQPVIQKDTFGNRTELSYELDGKIKDIRRLGNGNRNHQRILQQYEYNARGQIIGVVDGNRNPISYDVDSWGRITGIGFVDGVKEGYEYTPAGQVSRTIDGNGNAVQYRYNSLGKVSERIDQLGFTETFRYDEEGNLSLHIDRDGRQLQRACNVFGQPVYEKASDAEGKHTNISTWHYDSLGRVTRAVCDGKSYEYIYDAYGNLKEKRSNGKRLVSYTHDRAGQITEIRDPEGVCTRYEYDILGRRSRIYNNDGLEVRYGYDALNRIRHIRYGNGVETAYTYDGDGNIRTLETKAGENVLLSFAYQYDGNGNRTAKTGTQAALGGITSEITAGNNALDLSYNYDVRGQLLEERRNGASVSYAYDKAGNRIRKTDAQGEIRYLYNEKNQLVEEESPADRKQFSYDCQGGIIEEKNAAGIRRFSYNSRHQQTRVETETGNVQENRYDAEGLRFELLENGRRTSFVYHDGELLQEEGREEQGTSYHLGAGMEAFRRGQELSYYHRDEQLSTVFVTDGQGEIRNSYQYDAFGIPLETTEQLNNRIRYTGQQYDDVTGQYYLRARYYNPVAGRFMQEDVYQGDGLNLYAYCGNNPVVYDDPSGYERKACPPQGKISEGVDEDGTSSNKVLGGSFKDVDATRGPDEVGHHMPQNAYNKTIGVSRNDGPALLMSREDHALTRSFAGRGKATMKEDIELSARQRMAKDLWDIKNKFGTKYNEGIKQMLEYIETLPEFQK